MPGLDVQKMKYTLPVIFISLGLLWYSLRPIPALVELNKYKSFPTTSGTIQKIEIFGSTGPNKGDYLKGKFVYTIDGKEYISSSPTVPGGYSGDDSALYRKLKKIEQKENQATVYFNPEFPREAYLSVKTSGFQYFMDFVFGGVIIGMGIWMIIASKLQERSLNQSEQDNPITRP